ncbi:hypothetical protein M0802_002544 [Mischocyttarus mexicanus]|nr:hypothetical protein M0802_002544 [Mischocyttarus mexicanus]
MEFNEGTTGLKHIVKVLIEQHKHHFLAINILAKEISINLVLNKECGTTLLFNEKHIIHELLTFYNLPSIITLALRNAGEHHHDMPVSLKIQEQKYLIYTS